MKKGLTWYKHKLEKTIEVVCSLEIKPHILAIDSVVMIGIEDAPLPYAFCSEHKAYFGISADVSMNTIRLNEEPLAEIKEEEKHAGQ